MKSKEQSPLDFIKQNFDWDQVDVESDQAISEFLTPPDVQK